MNKSNFYLGFIFFSALLMASQSLCAQDGSNTDIADSLPEINENTVVVDDTTESVITDPPNEVDYNYYFNDKSYYHYDSPYVQRKVTPLSIKKMKEDDAFWYAKGVKQTSAKNQIQIIQRLTAGQSKDGFNLYCGLLLAYLRQLLFGI
jgi:hypothetical protein